MGEVVEEPLIAQVQLTVQSVAMSPQETYPTPGKEDMTNKSQENS